MDYQSHILPNGLRLVHKPTLGNVAYCGFIVNAGTRDEHEDEYGMAHFVEHLLFKGTKKRKAHHIINRMENVGGELNAYTNKEETVIYSIFLEEHFQRAFELLSDLLFHSEFPQHEIEKEIDVIIDEINSYEDSPSELIYDEFENLIFRDSELGHNILGMPELLKTFDSSKARKFSNKHYHPENIVFFSLGKTPFSKVLRLAEKYISEINISQIKSDRKKISTTHTKKEETDKDTAQSHVIIGNKSYSMHDDRRKALSLLNNILGGQGMNSRLNMSLRERKGYVYNVESSLTNYSDIGLFTIYFGSDQRNAEKCIRLIHKELKIMRDTQLTTSQLHAAKRQLIGQIGVANDNLENIALSLGKNFLHFNHISSLEEKFKQIDSLTSSQLLEVANEVFDEGSLSMIRYL